MGLHINKYALIKYFFFTVRKKLKKKPVYTEEKTIGQIGIYYRKKVYTSHQK